MNTKDYYNTHEVAFLLKIKLKSVIQQIKRGKYKDIIKCQCNHQSYLISKKEIEKLLEIKL